MKREHILSYIQGLKRREQRTMDFYDLMLFAGLSLELTHDLRKLSDTLQDVTDYIGKSAYMHGTQGAGKTVLAGHIFSETMRLNEWHCGSGEIFIDRITGKAKHSPDDYDYEPRYEGPEFQYERFYWYPGLISEVKRTFSKDYEGPSEGAILDRVIEADFVVLDDIGAEYTSEWSRNFTYMLIEERKTNLRPTLFTSNFSLEQLAEKYDSHKIVSRIVGMCADRVYKINGGDRRIKPV